MSTLAITLWASLAVVLLLVLVRSSGRKNQRKPRRSPPQALKSTPLPESSPGGTAEYSTVSPELSALHVLTLEEVDPAILDILETLVKDRPKPHPLFTAMTHKLEEPEEIAEAVGSEPAIAAELLRTVNSAAFALSTPISSIPHAISYLGVSYVKGLVAQAMLVDTLPATASDPDQQAAMTRLWKASQLSGAVTFILAQHLGLERPSIASTLALLSNLGNMSIVSARSEMAAIYAPGNSLLARVQKQQEVLGINSAIVGFLLAQHWELPAELLGGLRDSLSPLTPPPDLVADRVGWQRTLICYIGCRIGDAVSSEGLRDIATLDFHDPSNVDFTFLREHLEKAGLSQVWRSLDDPALRRKLNQSISLIGNS